MTANGHDRRDDNEDALEVRIAAMKDRLQQIAGGTMVSGEAPGLTSQFRESFWRRVLAVEEGPFTTLFDRLVAAGVEVPAPESLTDRELTPKLWEVIGRLAGMRVFISQTDHLSDRELYAHLWHESLREEMPVEPDNDGGSWHFDLLGTGSEEHLRLYLRFYADEQHRERWRQDFPDIDVPPHEKLPFDRDSHLPRAHVVRDVNPVTQAHPLS